MIRKHRKFNRPRHLFESERISQENEIVKSYGLKNKREIWKAKAKLGVIRNQAKRLVNSSEDEKEIFLNKLKKTGFNVKTLVDVLALTEEDILRRRLQTIVVKKGIATTAKGARQLITHKHILVGDRKVNIPSYLVSTDEEAHIKKVLKQKIKPKQIEEKIEVKE